MASRACRLVFETFVPKPHATGYAECHPDYNYLFNSYCEAVGPRHSRPDPGLLTRPPLDDVMVYRAHVDTAMEALLDNAGDDTFSGLEDLIELSLHYEQQHQKLALMEIKHVFSCHPLSPA